MEANSDETEERALLVGSEDGGDDLGTCDVFRLVMLLGLLLLLAWNRTDRWVLV